MSNQEWVPPACTLPTVDQPLRLAEFDDLFATALRRQQRPTPTNLRWLLDPTAEELARDLTARESACCSFFTFTVTTDPDHVEVQVEVPPSYVPVLDALADRAAGRMAR
jgi:hypothetical protein